MRSLFDLARYRVLANPGVFPCRELELSLPRSVFYDRFLRLDQELSVDVQKWLVNTAKCVPGVHNLHLIRISDHTSLGALLAGFPDIQSLTLHGSALSQRTANRGLSVEIIAVPNRVRSIRFVDVDFTSRVFQFRKNRLRSLCAEYIEADLKSFFQYCADRLCMFRGLTSLKIVERHLLDRLNGISWKLPSNNLFSQLSESSEHLSLQVVDIRMLRRHGADDVFTRFLNTKCAKTLRSLKTNDFRVECGGVYPILESLNVRMFAALHCHTRHLDQVFPKLTRVHIRLCVDDNLSAADLSTVLGSLRVSFDHVKDYTLTWECLGGSLCSETKLSEADSAYFTKLRCLRQGCSLRHNHRFPRLQCVTRGMRSELARQLKADIATHPVLARICVEGIGEHKMLQVAKELGWTFSVRTHKCVFQRPDQ